MTDAETILKLIETVDPADNTALWEIDCLCSQFIHGFFTGHHYTRSRDALKTIRPKGWQVNYIEQSWHHGWSCAMVWVEGDSERVNSPMWLEDIIDNDDRCFPTEELAELHAIIQAIDYER